MTLMIGSIIIFAGLLLSYDYANPGQNDYQSMLYVPGKTLIYLGLVLVLMGLPALWSCLAEKAKIVALIGFFLIFFGLNSTSTTVPLDMFLRGLSAHPAVMAAVNDAQKGNILSGIFLLSGDILLELGMIFLGIAVLVARSLPRTIGMLLLVSAAVKWLTILVFAPFLELIGEISFGLTLFGALTWCGYLLWTNARSQGLQEIAHASSTPERTYQR